MTFKKLFTVSVLFIVSLQEVKSQDFMLQGWYWDFPKAGFGNLWADTLTSRAQNISDAGFTQVWLPPLSLGLGGGFSVGYDIKDLYNLGSPSVRTGFGYRTKVLQTIAEFNKFNILPIADLVYNHRAGGLFEDNGAVAGWMKNYNLTKHNSGDACYPSDRVRCTLAIGGNTGRGAGKYYFKIRSASLSSDYYNFPYTFYARTIKVGTQPVPALTESALNGGSNCAQPHDTVPLGVNCIATIDNGGCGIDEFMVEVDTNDFFATGDNIIITFTNSNSQYSDHYIYGLWYTGNNTDLKDSVKYQTGTDFYPFGASSSGRAKMNYLNFKPNGNPTQLSGDWDYPYFFYDYDQNVPATRDTLIEWTKWMWTDVGTRGVRADAVKNLPYQFIGDLLNSLYAANQWPPMFVGEFYDYNPAALYGWVNNVKSVMTPAAQSVIDVRVFDFSLQEALRDACDAFGYDARNIFTKSIVDSQNGSESKHVVTFVNNHDFRTPSQAVDNDAQLAYAYILTNNQIGLPCVYYPAFIDTLTGTYNQDMINLIDIHKKFIYQSTKRDYLNRTGTPYTSNYISGAAANSLIYQLSGAPGCYGLPQDVIVAINFSGQTLRVDHQVNTTANFALSNGDTLIDVLRNSNFDYAVVNGSGQIYLELPPRSYSVWVKTKFPFQNAISASGAITFCTGDSVTLSSNINNGCFTYRWKKDGQYISFVHEPLLTVKESGTYECEVSYYGNFAFTSNSITINVSPVVPVVTSSQNVLTCTTAAISYQWYFSTDSITYNLIAGATLNQYTAAQTGWYYVLITDATGCTNTSIPIKIIFVGISNLDFNGSVITVSPSIVIDKLIVSGKLKKNQSLQLKLFDVSGKLCFYQVVNDGQAINANINMSKFPGGLYNLNIRIDNTQKTIKLVKH
jgi:Alpha amylase, catalytic domain